MLKKIITLSLVTMNVLFGDNQTTDLTEVVSQENLPFTVSLDQTELQVPGGWHSGAIAIWGDKCLLIAGRTNGLHGFDNGNVNNFPPQFQNKTLFVIDFKTMTISHKSLDDPSSKLSEEQIDTLSVTSPQFYQSGNTLYIAGGYGIDSKTNEMGTKPFLTALNIPKTIDFVEKGKGSLKKHIRQTSNPLLQVTGGFMDEPGLHQATLLIFGQNFTGLYTPNSNGEYTEEVRKFRVLDDGKNLYLLEEKYLMDEQYPAIYSTSVNPGNLLLFGAGGQFILSNNLKTYENGCLAFDKLKAGKTHVGYIVGGIQSTLPNTNTRLDSAASPYIFKVTLNKK